MTCVLCSKAGPMSGSQILETGLIEVTLFSVSRVDTCVKQKSEQVLFLIHEVMGPLISAARDE